MLLLPLLLPLLLLWPLSLLLLWSLSLLLLWSLLLLLPPENGAVLGRVVVDVSLPLGVVVPAYLQLRLVEREAAAMAEAQAGAVGNSRKVKRQFLHM